MLLNKDLSNYIKIQIKWKSYSDKNNLQYILELTTLENYIRTWKVDVYFQGFTIDFLRDKYFEEYLNLIKEIKGEEEYNDVKNSHVKKDKHLSKWIDFTHSWELDNWETIWIELWGEK